MIIAKIFSFIEMKIILSISSQSPPKQFLAAWKMTQSYLDILLVLVKKCC